MVAVCSRPVLKIAPLLQNDQVAVFFSFFEYCVLVPLSSRINKGKKRKALISGVRKKVLNN